MRTILTLFSLLIFFASTSSRVSAEFINVIAATASGTDEGSALNTVNGNGFISDPLGSDLGTHATANATQWLGVWPGTGTLGSTSSFTFSSLFYDFGVDTLVDRVLFWNYNGYIPSNNLSNRAVKKLTIFTSSDTNAYNNAGHTSWSPLATYDNIPKAPGNNSTLYGENWDVPDVTARYVRFGAFTSHGDVYNIGFAETRFLTTASVPEPSSLMMVAAGLISLSLRGRRRR